MKIITSHNVKSWKARTFTILSEVIFQSGLEISSRMFCMHCPEFMKTAELKTSFMNAVRLVLPPFTDGIKQPNNSSKDSKARKSSDEFVSKATTNV